MTDILDARPTADNLVLHHCAVADLHKHVAAESIDWIFTDPPYPREYLPCFGELADFAAHALKPGGGLMVMSGQYWLPQVIETLGKQDALTYWWIMSYDMADFCQWHGLAAPCVAFMEAPAVVFQRQEFLCWLRARQGGSSS